MRYVLKSSRCGNHSALLMLLIVAASPAIAQEPGVPLSQEARAAAVAVEAITARYPELSGATEALRREDAVLNEARLLPTQAHGPGEHPAAHEPGFIAAVSERLEMRTGALDDFWRCEGRPRRSCPLRGARAVVSLGEPAVDGDEARVPVEIVYQVDRDRRQPVHRTTFMVELRRADGCWRVSDTRVVSGT